MVDLEDLFRPLQDRPAVPGAGLDAIRDRARRIRRRRRLTATGVAGAVVAAVVLSATLATRSPATHVIAPVPGPTTTTPAGPFTGLGRLAVTTAQGITVVDGGRTTTIGGPGASAPAWSADGRTLAYLDGSGRLTVAGPSGRGPVVLLAAPASSFAWAPAGQDLAVAPRAGGLLVVTPAGRVTTLVPGDSFVTSFRWSPDGRSIAYAEAFPPQTAGPATRTDRLYVRATAAAAPTLGPYSPPSGDGIIIGDWWPDGRGLYLWPDPYHSSSIAADGLDLLSVPLDGTAPVSLGTTLATPRALAFSPDGSEVVVMTGGVRFIDQGKALERCAVGSARCTPVGQPAGVVSIAPAWSPDGRSVAFVRGAAMEDPEPSAWLPTTRLAVLDAATGVVRTVAPSLAGVGDPAFAAGATHLVFQHGTGIWLLDLATGAAQQLVGGVAPLVTQWPAEPAYAWFR